MHSTTEQLNAFQSCASDIAIIGGGLSGSLAAVVLGRAGYRVTLIDRQAAYPPEFRVEKIAGDQVESLGRLGLLDAIAAASVRFDRVLSVRGDRVIKWSHGPNYGLPYQDLVRTVRSEIPASVNFIIGRVADVQAGPAQQLITMVTGEKITARVVVLATGMSDALSHELGIHRRLVAKKHSLTFGFSIAPVSGTAFAFPSLTSYGERWGDGISYLSLFPVPGAMRANLFTFIDPSDPWTRELRRDPKSALLAAMPRLRYFLGDFHVIDKVQSWAMNLLAVENHQCHGAVLIGDAFQTSCPAAGTGISRLITDVERLCNVHMPGWLATPGMSAEKIAKFYNDPVKKAADARAARLSSYLRSVAMESGLGWTVRRRTFFFKRRLLGWIDRVNPVWATRMRRLQATRDTLPIAMKAACAPILWLLG